jgi:hypothetical protein
MAAKLIKLSSKEDEKFRRFLRTLEHKTWRQVLALIDAEYRSGSDQTVRDSSNLPLTFATQQSQRRKSADPSF